VCHVLSAGWTVADCLIGRYLNPRIWKLDVKIFFLYNICILGDLAICAITFIEAYQREKVTAAMILLMSYTAVLTASSAVLQVQWNYNF